MKKHLKIKTISRISVILTIAIALLCVVLCIFGKQKYTIVSSSTYNYINAEKSIKKFEVGTKKLNRQVRLAVSTVEQSYIDEYFLEADVIKSREKAIEDLEKLVSDSSGLQYLEKALELSNKLIDTDKYALRLIEDVIADENTSIPSGLIDIELKTEDKELSDADKIDKARQLVNSVGYETNHTFVSNEVSTSLNKVSSELLNKQNNASDVFKDVYKKLEIAIVLLVLIIIIDCALLYTNVIKPLLIYNDSIKKDELIPVLGAKELQALATTYNDVYIENEERERLMKHNAEHDPLTGLLNRGSFDSMLDIFVKDNNHFALILIDVDNFKTVNDTYGHATGDVILKKVATLLYTTFRTIDHVCRIGGDEFAIIMVEMNSNLNYTIKDKIDEINKQLAISKGGEPLVSLSVGVALTDRENPTTDIFKDADKALYITKENGRNGINFY